LAREDNCGGAGGIVIWLRRFEILLRMLTRRDCEGMFGVNSSSVDSLIGDNRIWLAVVGSSIAGKRSAASSVTFGVTKGLCSPWEELVQW